MAGNINDCLADTNCIGMVENVDTRKVVVGVENEGVLNTLKINDIVVLGGSNSDEKLIGILTKVTKKKVEFDETEQTEDLSYSNNCCVINLVGSFYNKYGAGKCGLGHERPAHSLAQRTDYAQGVWCALCRSVEISLPLGLPLLVARHAYAPTVVGRRPGGGARLLRDGALSYGRGTSSAAGMAGS